MLNDIPVGIYEVTATHSGIGSGVGSVAVKDGDVSNVNIKLVTGTFVGPNVHISTPYGGSFFVGDEIGFVAYVSHSEQSLTELAVEWSSNVGGVLDTDSPNSNGLIGFGTSGLSIGQHTIYGVHKNNPICVNIKDVHLKILKLMGPMYNKYYLRI